MGLFANKRFTIVTISLLAILNIVLISVIVLHQAKRDYSYNRGDRSAVLADRLEFTEAQREQYRLLNANHKEERQNLQKKIEQTRRQFFMLSHQAKLSAEQADSLTSQIGTLVSKMERNSFNYISNVRAICTDEQLQKLDSYLERRMRGKNSSKPEEKRKR